MSSISRRAALSASALSVAALVSCAKKSTDVGTPATTAASKPADQPSTSGSASSAASGGGATGTIRVFLSGDTNMQDLWEKALIPAFTKANPGVQVKVQLDLHGEHDAQTQAKLTAANAQGKDGGMDLVDAGFVSTLAQAGVMEPTSTDNIANLAGVPENVIKAGMGGGVPYRGSSVLLAYNSQKITTPPQTLDEMLAWIKDNAGQFTYCPPKSGGSGGAFVTTVLDKHLDQAVADRMRVEYDTKDQAGWQAGFDALRALNPVIYQKGVYPNGNKQVLELLAKGQIGLATVWSDQFLTGQKTGLVPEHVKVTQINNPSFTGGAAYLGIPRLATNKASALVLANWVLSPEAQEIIIKEISGFPVIPLDKMSPETQQVFKDAHPDVLRPGYIDQHGKDMNNQWDQQVPGQ